MANSTAGARCSPDHILLCRGPRRTVFSRATAESSAGASWPATLLADCIGAVWSFALQQTASFQLAVCSAGQHRRGVLWPSLARPSSRTRFRDDPYLGRCAVVAVVPIEGAGQNCALTAKPQERLTSGPMTLSEVHL